jgi:hypothetical protein
MKSGGEQISDDAKQQRTASRELSGHTARSLAMGAEHTLQEDFYKLTVRTDSGTRVARFSLYADAMTAYDNARLDGAISAVVDRIQHTSHGTHSYRLAELG